MFFRNLLNCILIFCQIISIPCIYAGDRSTDAIHTKPVNLGPRPSAEYYSTSPEAGLLIPINIWGNVREPGIHYVPIGSNVLQSLSAAGGPTENGDISAIRIMRKNQYSYADLLKSSAPPPVQANDTIVVTQTYKADMPLIFSGISTLLSIATLYFVMSARNK